MRSRPRRLRTSGRVYTSGRPPEGDIVTNEHQAVRLRLAADVSEEYEAIRDNLIAAAKGAEKEVYITCTHCSRRTPARISDYGNSVKAAQLLLDQGFGRLGYEKGKPNAGTVALLGNRPLQDLTDEELETLVSYHDAQKAPEEIDAERRDFELWKEWVAAGKPTVEPAVAT